MITATELADIRSALAETRTGTCQVWRKAAVPDGRGGTTDTWNNHGAAVPCRTAPGFVQGRESTTAQRTAVIAAVFVYVAPDVDVDEADQLVVTTSRRTVTLNVVGIRFERDNDWEKTIEAVEVD